MKSQGERLKYLRTSHKKSQEYMMKLLNVSISTLKRLEADADLKSSQINALVEEFGITEAWILRGEGKRYKEYLAMPKDHLEMIAICESFGCETPEKLREFLGHSQKIHLFLEDPLEIK